MPIMTERHEEYVGSYARLLQKHALGLTWRLLVIARARTLERSSFN